MQYDAIVVGAGAAGLMCALQAGKRKKKVLVLEHNNKIGNKILISGGGRCNFTNLQVTSHNFVSENEHFCKSALTRFPPEAFIELLNKHNVPFSEKKLGQLFCQQSAKEIVKMLESECTQSEVTIHLGAFIKRIEKNGDFFEVDLGAKKFSAPSLVIATGGLSIPKIGATGFGYEIAKQFGLNIVPTAAALDGFVFDPSHSSDALLLRKLSGISIDCNIRCGESSFRENLLFTHRGLSGPAALQASLYWRRGESLLIDLLPDLNLLEALFQKKKTSPNTHLFTFLSSLLPDRFVELFFEGDDLVHSPLGQTSDKNLEHVASRLQSWHLVPTQTVGYNKAEVTRGGVCTQELSSKTMEAKNVRGLYFIGEVVDVTGWLGGYNFQWAWASGWAAAQNL